MYESPRGPIYEDKEWPSKATKKMIKHKIRTNTSTDFVFNSKKKRFN